MKLTHVAKRHLDIDVIGVFSRVPTAAAAGDH